MAVAAEGQPHRILVGGSWVESANGETRETVDPYKGQPWALLAEAGPEDVDRAVAAARKAFEEGPWPQFGGRERAACLRRLAELLRRDRDRLAEIESHDTGKVLAETRAMLDFIPSWYDYYAGWADKLQGDVIPTERPSFLVYTLREPIGVVAAITAWNSPLLMAAYKLGPALAVGCTVVLKPAEQAPVSTVELGRLVEEAGIPPGVVNVITGGPETGAALVSHPGIDKVSFTGSVPTGKAVSALAAQNLAPVSLELGGKSPHLVFADADLDAAANGIAAGIFTSTGQSCGAGSRVLVHRDVSAELTEKVVARAREIRLGNPFAPGSQMGPLSFEAHMKRVLAAIENGVEEGARVATGGGRASGEELDQGYFVEPTVLVGVRNEMRVAQEEIFGPVVCLIQFETESEGVALANGTPYGLAAAVWTGKIGRAHRVAGRLRAGTVWINSYRMMSAAVPWGGYKQSGHGREEGFESLADYTQTKAVWVEMGEEE